MLLFIDPVSCLNDLSKMTSLLCNVTSRNTITSRGLKDFFKLNSAEHKIYNALKHKNGQNQ